MPDQTTPVLGLVKPEVGASKDTWGVKLNSDLDILDALFEANQVSGTPVLAISHGGTSAETAAEARTNLGLGSMATQNDAGDASMYARVAGAWSLLNWATLAGKPSVFPPSAHVHPISEVTGLATALATETGIEDAASRNLALSDAGCMLVASSSGDILYTIPPQANVAWPSGTRIDVTRFGTGTVRFAPGSGVTIRSKSNLLSISTQYAAATLWRRNTDEWVLIGDLG